MAKQHHLQLTSSNADSDNGMTAAVAGCRTDQAMMLQGSSGGVEQR